MLHQSLGMQRTQGKLLKSRFEQPLQILAQACAPHWYTPEVLEKLLHDYFLSVPQASALYAIDKSARQVSATVSRHACARAGRGADLSQQAYAHSLYPKRYLTLVPVYSDSRDGNPKITALQPVWRQEQFLGFIAADLNISNPPFSMSINSPARRPDTRTQAGHYSAPCAAYRRPARQETTTP